MRRLVPALLAVAALASPVSAAPRQAITDPRGDWVTPNHDVLGARLSSALVGKQPVLRGELKLAAAPDATPATYAIGFSIGCHGYTFEHSWAAEDYHTVLTHTSFCTERGPDPLGGPDEEFPATIRITGDTLRWEAPYAGGIRRGQTIDGMFAWGCPRVCTGVAVGDLDYSLLSGDLAYGTISYVVGSDLPRR